MPEKFQSDCYRTVQSVRYVNYCDVLEDKHEGYVRACKENKIPHRLFKHPDGFKRLFVHEQYVMYLTSLTPD